MNSDWLAASSFEQTQELIAAITTLSALTRSHRDFLFPTRHLMMVCHNGDDCVRSSVTPDSRAQNNRLNQIFVDGWGPLNGFPRMRPLTQLYRRCWAWITRSHTASVNT
jgi:hypothetical protein